MFIFVFFGLNISSLVMGWLFVIMVRFIFFVVVIIVGFGEVGSGVMMLVIFV